MGFGSSGVAKGTGRIPVGPTVTGSPCSGSFATARGAEGSSGGGISESKRWMSIFSGAVKSPLACAGIADATDPTALPRPSRALFSSLGTIQTLFASP